MIKFYGYKKCSTSLKAEKWLKENGIDYEFIDVTLTPPDEKLLTTTWKKSGLPIQKLFNTSGKSYRDGGYSRKIKNMSETEILHELSLDGRLIKRPLIILKKGALFGWNESESSKIIRDEV